MKALDMSAERAEDALVLLAQHVPPAVVIGRPLVVRRDEEGTVQVLTEQVGTGVTAIWTVADDHAERLLSTAAGVELVRWTGGREVRRVLADLDRGRDPE